MTQDTLPTSLFGPKSGGEKPAAALLETGTLSFGVVKISEKGLAYSQATGGEYMNIEIVLYGNGNDKRRIFHMLPNPLDSRNSESWRAMGISAITRMLESNGFFIPGNPESYQKLTYEGVTFDEMLEPIIGTDIAVEIGVDKGTDGRADRNNIKTFLTPSPEPSSARGKAMWDLLMAGIYTSVKPKFTNTQAPKGVNPGAGARPPAALGPAALARQRLAAGGSAAPVTASEQATGTGLKSPAAAASGLRRPSFAGGKKKDADKPAETPVEPAKEPEVPADAKPF